MIRLAPRLSRRQCADGFKSLPVALLMMTGTVVAQTPPAASPPAATTAPSTPASPPTPPATQSEKAPATPPATQAAPPVAAPAAPTEAQKPATPPPPAAQAPATPAPAAQAADPFGEEITLAPKTVASLKGSAKWDAGFETITNALKTLQSALEKQNIKATGNPMVVYTSTDDAGFTFLAEIPVEEGTKSTAKEVAIIKSPDGKTLKFVHRGSYDTMDNTYEAITNHLDERKLEAKDTFIEEYMTDPLKTAEDKLVINVFVPLR